MFNDAIFSLFHVVCDCDSLRPFPSSSLTATSCFSIFLLHFQPQDDKMDGQNGQHAKMRVPRTDDSLCRSKRKSQNVSAKDTGVISGLQKFTNDGSFMHEFKSQRRDDDDRKETPKFEKSSASIKPALSANQLAAKVMQLRMKGKHEEADILLGWEIWSTNTDNGVVDAMFPCLEELIIDECPKLVEISVEALSSLRVLEVIGCGDGVLRSLVHVASSSLTKLEIESISGLTNEVWGGVMEHLGAVEEVSINGCNELRYLWESEAEKEAEVCEGENKVGASTTGLHADETTSRTHNKRKEEDADMHLARSIMQNRQYSVSGQADNEYDYDEGPRRKKQGKGDNGPRLMGNTCFDKNISTQQERCNFCFENPKRPRHLVIAIANFTYLMLPHWQPVVPGHCCILPLQHELATRSIDDNVWDEIRNFKKCLVMMFAKQEKDVVFLETVMDLRKQSRHCLIECIPLPSQVAKQAPLFFKKAIDEAEDEWSQHSAKKLIDTSEKGLRGSIPKDFAYFHVEFGLKEGFVHVIDDESRFKNNFGLDVIRGMLNIPVQDTHRHQKHDAQKVAASNFARDWDPFDWTKKLD